MAKINKTDEEWKKQLTPESYEVTRKKGTERPYTGKYDKFFEEGIYRCICCGAELFNSKDKFDAGCGWPSFTQPKQQEALEEHHDPSIPNRPRTEVVCHACGAHLGHVFPDGPLPTGLRYCINSVALNFEEESKSNKKTK